MVSFAFHRFRMKVAVVVALLVSSATARPQHDRRQQAADESEVGGATGHHLFHGSHLWGLEDFHEGAEDAEDRKRRAAEEEEGAAGHHLFHGSHLWGLEDFHEGAEDAEDRKRRAAEEEGAGATGKEKRTIDDDADDGSWVPLQNSDGNTFFQYNIFD